MFSFWIVVLFFSKCINRQLILPPCICISVICMSSLELGGNLRLCMHACMCVSGCVLCNLTSKKKRICANNPIGKSLHFTYGNFALDRLDSWGMCWQKFTWRMLENFSNCLHWLTSCCNAIPCCSRASTVKSYLNRYTLHCSALLPLVVNLIRQSCVSGFCVFVSVGVCVHVCVQAPLESINPKSNRFTAEAAFDVCWIPLWNIGCCFNNIHFPFPHQEYIVLFSPPDDARIVQ